jgi:diguanylate cyclase (GGDEF)-like protein
MKILEILQKYRKQLILFTLIEIALFIVLQIYTQKESDAYLKERTKDINIRYSVILEAFAQKAQIAYDTLIDTKEVKTLLAQALQTAPNQREQIRQELYRTLYDKFQALQKYGFKQLHFHTPDSHSLLRMHAPKRYDDDLSSFRHTVVYVNDTHQKISGFEEGIASNGYRFVFPVYDEKNYLGSVELSFSAYALADFLKNEFIDTDFIISKKAVIQPNNNYVTAKIDNRFVTDKNSAGKLQISTPLPTQKLDTIHPHAFSIPFKQKENTYIQTLLPVKNPVTNSTDAFMIILSDGKFLADIQSALWTKFGILSIIVVLLFLRHIRTRNFQERMHKQNKRLEHLNRKLKKILDTQENMIIITDGKEMVEVNARVLEFLGYQNYEQMQSRHNCICDFFIKHKDYFHLGRVPEDEMWIEYLEKLPPDQRIVTMMGVDMEAKAFQVNITKYDDKGSSIITFTDITEMIIRQKILQYKAQHDRLTDIYNRQKIDEVLERICGYSTRRKEEVCVIMFDIDHFKTINDTYGHDIGDKVLKAIATLIKRNIREEDIFGRWGGEEFIVILRHTSLENSSKKAEILREKIASMKHHEIPKVTASFGVTKVLPGESVQSLMKRVDIALYKAKHEGRNRITVSNITQSQLVLT